MADQIIPVGLCQCGCGQETRVAKRTDERRGTVKGEYQRFVYRHSSMKGPGHPQWKGGRTTCNGYALVTDTGVKVTGGRRYIREHVAVIERVIGRKLKNGECGHHVDENKRSNDPCNLVACQDQNYHILLHIRARALAECGNANFRKCPYCKKYDDIKNLEKYNDRNIYRHVICEQRYKRQWSQDKLAAQRRAA